MKKDPRKGTAAVKLTAFGLVALVFSLTLLHMYFGYVLPGATIVAATGKSIRISYSPNNLSMQEMAWANQLLQTNLPALYRLFWEPRGDVSVVIHRGSCPEAASRSCTTFMSLGQTFDPKSLYGDIQVWISPSEWDASHTSTWMHEFTHVLQQGADGPGSFLSGDARLLYAEPTAMAVESIMFPSQDAGCQQQSDLAAEIPNFGTAQATFNYYEADVQNENHAVTSVWTDLYRLDPDIFQEVNRQLFELPQSERMALDVRGLRDIVSTGTSEKAVLGVPVEDWLKSEGMLGRSEVQGKISVYVACIYYQELEGPPKLLYARIAALTTDSALQLDPNATTVSVYDAKTGVLLYNSSMQQFVEDGPPGGLYMLADGNQWPDDIRVIFHVVGTDVSQDLIAQLRLSTSP